MCRWLARLHKLRNEDDELLRRTVQPKGTLADNLPIRTTDADIVRHVKELANLLTTSSPKALRRFLETSIERIGVFPDGHADIRYFAPLDGLLPLSRLAGQCMTKIMNAVRAEVPVRSAEPR